MFRSIVNRARTFGILDATAVLFLLISSPSPGGAVVLWDNGPLVTHPGTAAGQCEGDDVSLVQTSLDMSWDGYAADESGTNRLADDFTLGHGSDLTGMTFFAYQFAANSETCTIDTVHLQIWSGQPGAKGSSVYFGDLTTNRFASCEYSGIVRQVENQIDCSRRVMAVHATLPDVGIPSGTYWVEVRFGVSSGNPVEVPPTTILGQTSGCGGGCSGRQWNGASWVDLVDQRGAEPDVRQSIPFLVEGLPDRTISDGDAYFTRGSNPFSNNPLADLRGVSQSFLPREHLFQTGWAFRVAGDTQETFFPNTSSPPSFGGNSSVANWADVGGRGLFSAQESAFIHEVGSGAYVQMTMAVTNLSNSQPLTLDVFHMADLDVGGGGAGDSARLGAWTPSRLISISDSNGEFAEYIATPAATSYLVRTFGGDSVWSHLAIDTNVDNFADSGLPFGPADFTGGYQFPLVLAPSQTKQATVFLSVNQTLQCDKLEGILCDGFETGNFMIWSSTAP